MIKRFLAFLSVAALSVMPVLASGTFSVNGTFPLVYQSGTWYEGGYMYAPSGVTSSNTITNLYYSWQNINSTPPSNQIYLCYNNGNNCLNLTIPAGGTSAFNGLPANTVFEFWIRGNTGTVVPYNRSYGGGYGFINVSYQ